METGGKFNMHMSEEEKKKYSQFGKAHGKTSIAKLIRTSLEVVMRNPVLLEPTESQDSQEILKSVKESFNSFDKLLECLDTINSRLDKFEKYQEFTLEKLGVSKRELMELQQKDLSGEAIFDE